MEPTFTLPGLVFVGAILAYLAAVLRFRRDAQAGPAAPTR